MDSYETYISRKAEECINNHEKDIEIPYHQSCEKVFDDTIFIFGNSSTAQVLQISDHLCLNIKYQKPKNFEFEDRMRNFLSYPRSSAGSYIVLHFILHHCASEPICPICLKPMENCELFQQIFFDKDILRVCPTCYEKDSSYDYVGTQCFKELAALVLEHWEFKRAGVTTLII